MKDLNITRGVAHLKGLRNTVEQLQCLRYKTEKSIKSCEMEMNNRLLLLNLSVDFQRY